MKNVTRHTGKFEIVERMPQSKAGNPRYRVIVDGYTCCTAVDSSIAYAIDRYNGKTVEATIGMHYGTVTLNSVRVLTTP